ncbi:hypothetical protein [Pseudolactococcus insecticola]|uniref:Uncharacterized protein n=1 Tax=Pseudolactococcus insecticola TaxID=2709158 RepID=A0A6A0B947_9LACT|nr:hypothetical protein [Lactococcus insecticola]GFH41255.1 hypothetical protein Hs20B_16530 [Lactococcus insecticola]
MASKKVTISVDETLFNRVKIINGKEQTFSGLIEHLLTLYVDNKINEHDDMNFELIYHRLNQLLGLNKMQLDILLERTEDG